MNAAEGRPTSTERALDLAEFALQRSRPGEALRLLEPVLASEPENAEAWLLVTRAHLDAGDNARALDTSGRTCALLPDVPVALRLRALALSAAGQPSAARAAAGRAIQVSPDEAWNHAVLALVVSNSGVDLGLAKAAASYAVELDPDDAGLHVVRSRVALAQGRTKSARVAALAALALDPASADAQRAAAMADSHSPSFTRMARSLTTQADQMRVGPADDQNLLTMGLVVRNVLGRSIWFLCIAVYLTGRTWAGDTASASLLSRVGSVVVVSIVATYVGYQLSRFDRGVRAYVGQTLRRPRLALAVTAALTTAVSVLLAAFRTGSDIAWALVVAVAAWAAALALVRLDSIAFARENGAVLLPIFAGRLWLVASGVTGLFGLVFGGLAFTDTDVSARDEDAVVAAVVLAVAAGCLAVWLRRRR